MELQHKKVMRTVVSKLDNERLALGIKIFKFLHTQKSATSEVVNANVAASIRNLLATSKEMAKTSKELAKDVKKFGKEK
jgi:acyl-CoA thioesterase FadM